MRAMGCDGGQCRWTSPCTAVAESQLSYLVFPSACALYIEMTGHIGTPQCEHKVAHAHAQVTSCKGCEQADLVIYMRDAGFSLRLAGLRQRVIRADKLYAMLLKLCHRIPATV